MPTICQVLCFYCKDYLRQKYLKCINYCYIGHCGINFTWVFPFNPPNSPINWNYFPQFSEEEEMDWVKCFAIELGWEP